MNKTEYLNELSKYLKKLPKSDYEDAMNHFEESFDEVGEEGEEELMKEFGSPRKLASEIISKLLSEEMRMENVTREETGDEDDEDREDESKIARTGKKKNRLSKVFLLLILAILAAPIGLPLTIAAFALLFSFVIVSISLLFAIVCSIFTGIFIGVKMIIVSFFLIPKLMSAGILLLGMGLTIISIGLFLGIFLFHFKNFLVFIFQKMFQKIKEKRRNFI